jgi:CxxC motif-containing protein (DUF1111 family)
VSAGEGLRATCAGLALISLAACDDARAPALADEPVLNAALMVRDTTKDAFSLPMPGLTPAHLASFFVGNSFFNQNWVMAPASVSERDGLGPLFNARSCSGCHFKDGRGRPPGSNEAPRGFLLRISMPGSSQNAAPLPHPVYGDQLQTEALPGLAPEVSLGVTYDELPGQYADGESFSLRRPHYALTQPGFGALPAELRVSPRVAPQTLGMGLLEAVPEAELVRLADPDDRNGDGISGRVQRVFDVASGQQRVGRFGWKAEQPSVRAQVAAAFVGDMGITSQLFPLENHSAAQADCAQHPSGGAPELTPETLDHVVLYMRTLALPARRGLPPEQARQGSALFSTAGCDACHARTLRSAAVLDLPELSARTFEPFSDLLLHDLGDELSDERPSFAAEGSEWRTPPLWGVGLLDKVNGHQLLLHDGRARGVAEAILWHAGEAAAARRSFVHMSRTERAALVAFVESL